MTENTNTFGDTSWVNQDNALTILPSVIQWRRGDLVNENELLRDGCWQLPVENFTMLDVEEWGSPINVLHGGGVVVPSFLLGTIHIAILAHKKRWFIQDSEGNIAFVETFTEGAKSKLQIWALCRELKNEPVIVSVARLNAKSVSQASMDFIRKVITPAARMTKTRFGRHHFWMPLTTGNKQETRNNQYITPPVLALEDINIDVMRSLFTGREVAELAEDMLDEAKEWATAKDENSGQQVPNEQAQAQTNGQGEPPDLAVAQTQEEHEIPF